MHECGEGEFCGRVLGVVHARVEHRLDQRLQPRERHIEREADHVVRLQDLQRVSGRAQRRRRACASDGGVWYCCCTWHSSNSASASRSAAMPNLHALRGRQPIAPIKPVPARRKAAAPRLNLAHQRFFNQDLCMAEFCICPSSCTCSSSARSGEAGSYRRLSICTVLAPLDGNLDEKKRAQPAAFSSRKLGAKRLPLLESRSNCIWNGSSCSCTLAQMFLLLNTVWT